MPDYVCKKCGTDFKKKWNYEYHINRKNPCIGTPINNLENREIKNEKIENIENELLIEYKCEYCMKEYSSSSNLNKHIKTCKIKINIENEKKDFLELKKEKSKKGYNSDDNKEEKTKIIEKDNMINIDYFKGKDIETIKNELIQLKSNVYQQLFNSDNEKVISINLNENNNKNKEENMNTNTNKYRKKNRKEDNSQDIEEAEIIKEIRKEIVDLKNLIKNNNYSIQNSNPINNHYTFLTQINQNFYIHNFGKECIDQIQTDFYMNLLTSPYESVPKLIEEIHFNQQKPYNTNIILPNQNLPFIYIYENGKWIIANKDDTLNQLVDTNFERVDDFYEHYKKYLETNIIEEYEEYSNNFTESNLKEDIQKDVSNVLEKGSQKIIENIIEKRKNLIQNDTNQTTQKNQINLTNKTIENLIPNNSLLEVQNKMNNTNLIDKEIIIEDYN